MSNRNNRKPNIFQRVAQTVKKGVNRILGIDTPKKTQDLNQTKNKSIIKKMIQRIRPPKTGKLSGTTKRIPTAKYSDFEKGWGANKQLENISRKMKETGQDLELPGGNTLDADQVGKLQSFTEMADKKLKERRDNIVENAYDIYGDTIGMNVEMQMERAIERDKRKFTSGVFEDLREQDLDAIMRDLEGADSITDFIEGLLDDNLIKAKGDAIRYRDNWSEALFNVYGDNTTTRAIVDRVYENLDLDTFMNTLYNPASVLAISFIYSADKMAENLVMMEREIDLLESKQDGLKKVI